MTDRPQTTGDDRSQDTPADGFRRREFVALGAGASATMLAGCAGDGGLTSGDGSDSSDGSDGPDGSQALTGNFRLLISDAPADIDDFDRLDVTLDRARVFEARDEDDGGDEEEESDDAEGDDEEEDDAEEDGGDDDTDAEDEDDEEDGEDEGEDEDDEDDEDEGEDDEDDRGFTVVDLDDATVDLTRVIEEDAMAVFDGEIPAGSYEKIELSVTTVEGTVDGEEVDVKLPSEKLQITNGFEVTPDEPVSFVFDINVVKRGQNNGYILQPVISGSGVAGRDVEVNEIDDDDEEEESDDEEDDDEEADDEEAVESADEDDGDDGATENETADAENGTADGS